MVTITEEIANALKRQQDRPLQVRDAVGRVYYVLTDRQFQRYVYDDSELTPDEMAAAATFGLDDPQGWSESDAADDDGDENEAAL